MDYLRRMATDPADHAQGVPLLGFHLHQLSVLERCSDKAAGGTDAAEAVPGLHHHVLRSREAGMAVEGWRMIVHTDDVRMLWTEPPRLSRPAVMPVFGRTFPGPIGASSPQQ